MAMASTIAKGSVWLSSARTQTACPSVTSSAAPSVAPTVNFVFSKRTYCRPVLGVHREGPFCCTSSGISSPQSVGFGGLQFSLEKVSAFNSWHGGTKTKKWTGVIRAVSHGERLLSGDGEGTEQPLRGSDDAKAEATIAGRDSSTTASTSKVCPVCRQAKLHVDFDIQKKIHMRRDECRACLAVVKLKNLGREMHHLGMSVEQAWLHARRCRKCGYVKELRDFGREASKPQGVRPYCRACLTERNQNLVEVPVDTPQSCRRCGEVKPADQYNRSKTTSTGLSTLCKECQKKRYREGYARMKLAGSHLDRKVKTCSICKLQKPASEYYKHFVTIDCLRSSCKACHASLKAKR